VNVLFVFVYEYIFYDKIAKIEEEFNILICSRSRIINLYVSCISNIRWKDKILKLL
jgi:septum formation inhibitor-activating ATPase MinD